MFHIYSSEVCPKAVLLTQYKPGPSHYLMLDVEQSCQWNFAIFGEGWDPSRPLIRNLWKLQWNLILLTSWVRVTGAVQAELQDQLHQDVLAMCRMWIKTRGGRPGPGPWWCCQTRRRYGCSTILSAPISFISFHVLACLNSCLGCLHKWTTNQKK